MRRVQASHPASRRARHNRRGPDRGGGERARGHRRGRAVRRACRLARGTATRRRAVPDRRARHGQVRRLRAELRQRRRRDLRGRPRRDRPRNRNRSGRRHGRRTADGHQAGDRPDRGVLADHTRGHDLPDRPEPPARGAQRPARAHPGQPRRVLRALGQDVGVPGPAQGPPRGGGHGTWAAVRRRARPHDLASLPAGTLRRRRPGHAAPGGKDPARGAGRAGDQAGPRWPA